MVQTFTLRGINIGVRKSFAALAKVFRKVFQRLSLRSPKSFADIAKVFGMANVIPYSTIYYTIEHRTINHIARKFITDKCRYDPNQTKRMVQLQYKAWDIYSIMVTFRNYLKNSNRFGK